MKCWIIKLEYADSGRKSGVTEGVDSVILVDSNEAHF